MNRKKEGAPRKIYSYAFKQQVVLEFDNGQISRRALAIKYSISSTTLDRWIEKYSVITSYSIHYTKLYDQTLLTGDKETRPDLTHFYMARPL